MLKIISGLFLLIIVLILVFLSLKKENTTTTLGKELADAQKNEIERLESDKYLPSPMPDYNYSKWENEKSLINPIKNELDKFIVNLCKEYSVSDNNKRNEIRCSLSMDDIYTLLEFCKRSVIFGIRDSTQYIDVATIAISMVDPERCDYRDILVAMSFLNHGINKMKLNSDQLFKKSLTMSNTNMAQLLTRYINSKPDDKTLETMAGYTEVKTKFGIGFIEIGYEKYEPKHDLVDLGFRISDYIENDKYCKASLSMAENLPLIWIGKHSNKKISSILESSSGTISINAYLKNGIFKELSSQMLLIYMVECADSRDATELVNESLSSKSKSFFKIALSEDEIFCILIARSIKEGIEPLEDNKSIERFREPLGKLIKQFKNT